VRGDWKRLLETGFHDFKLEVGGLVEKPVELTLAELEQLGLVEHITSLHRQQGTALTVFGCGFARHGQKYASSEVTTRCDPRGL
jgi:DMSO/TMAO reductase YedYZ molybdopterin-dependent catalytic subunit